MKTSIYQLKWGTFNLIEGDFISQYAALYGEWSDVEVQFFLENLNSSSNVIEVGSNIGMHAVPIAKKISGGGKLFCFEPQRVIFQTLCANLSLNQLTNVYAYNLGVGEDEQLIEIPSSNYETAWNYGSFSLDKGFSTEGDFIGVESRELIHVISLDKHPEVNRLEGIDLLKIDAEGFELNVLNGAKNLIERHKPIIFVEAHIHHSHELISYLDKIGYKCYWFISERYQKNNYFKQEQFLGGMDFNLACFHKGKQSTLPEELRTTPNNLLTEIPIVTVTN